MLQIRYKSIVLKLLTTVMLFASLAPTVSHALASFTGNTGFTQRICTTNAQGEATIVLQVKTTMGQQLSTALTIKADALNVQDSQSINSHFEHCPFCTNLHVDALIAKPHDLIVAQLAIEAQKIATETKLNGFFQAHFLPPSQAPPQL